MLHGGQGAFAGGHADQRLFQRPGLAGAVAG